MPTPSKTSRDEIVAAARDLIAEFGVEVLTVQAVAERVGVRGPSLYKHFADRSALLREVELTVVADLGSALAAAGRSRDHRTALRAMAIAYRRFARESPGAYSLIFNLQSADAECQAARRHALEPALLRLEALWGDRGLAFTRARILTSFLHGFVSMEAAGAFRMGGNIEEAFFSGIALLLSKD